MKSFENSLYTKKQLLSWLNDLLKININTIQELSNGAVFCQLLDAFCQGSVRMQKINWTAKLQHQNLNNLKILSTAMLAIGIDKKFDASRVSQRKTQDILELLQWFRKYFLSNHMKMENYDPISRRKSLSTQKNHHQVRNSLQNARKQKTSLIKPTVSQKREPDDIILQQAQLKRCFKVNKQIQKILAQPNFLPAQKKLDLIKNILFNKNFKNSQENIQKQSNNIQKKESQSQSSNIKTIPDQQKHIIQLQKPIKIQQSHYNLLFNNQNIFSPSNFSFKQSKANTSQMLLENEQKNLNIMESQRKTYKSDNKNRN